MLQLVTSGFNDEVVPLRTGDLLLIGRGTHCDIRLEDPSASRVHCRVLARDGKVFLTDAGSRWGTFVNGNRVTECELRPGDEITIGETILTLQAEGAPEATTLARHSEVQRPWDSESQPVEVFTELPASPQGPLASPVRGGPILPHRGPLIPGDFIGRTFLRYNVHELVRRTGSGLQFRAMDQQGIAIHLKLFHPGQFADDVARKRFLRAVETVRGLRHPHLLPLDDGGCYENICFAATEFIEGQNAAELIHQIGISGMLDWRRTLLMAFDLVAALEHLEEQCVIHRDLTPQHILIRKSDGHAVLSGLLLAKALDDRQPQLTQTGDVMGDLAFQSPEQLGSGDAIDSRSDLYQLGATLYALLAGRPPFGGRTPIETMTQVLTVNPAPPTRFHLAIPPLLEGLVLRLLNKRPEDRVANAHALMKELDRIRNYCGH